MVSLTFPLKPDWPITARFGEDFGRGPHRGVDFGCPIGTPLFACAPGIIRPFTNDGSFGNGVCIEHDGGAFYSLVAHMVAISGAIGDQVKRGDFVGYSGNTGASTGPHVHWQVCVNSEFPLDPTFSRDPILMIGSTMAEFESDMVRVYQAQRDADLSSGKLAGGAEFLPLFSQVVGVDDSTFTDAAKVAAIRAKLGIS